MIANKTINSINDISQRQAAIFAGLGMLIICILAPFGFFYAIKSHIVSGDAAGTVSNIMASERLFRIGIICLLINAVFDVVIAWGLYVLLAPVNKSFSLLSAWLRIVYSAILVVALSNLFSSLHLISGADYLSAFEPNQLNAQVMIFIDTFYNVWNLGLVIFALHLFVLGYLIYKSVHFPKFLGIFLAIAGFGYFHDHIGKFIFPNYNITISEFTFIGEFLLLILVIRKAIKGFEQK